MDPSKNNRTSTPNNTPPVSPPHPPSEHDNTPTGTNPITEGSSSENVIMKTPEEVWAELTAGDDDGGDDNHDGGAQDGGDASRPVAMAVTVDGSNVPVMGSGGAGGSAKGSKKRKSNQVKDPPAGIPTCPECKRQFSTWKAAFGHMRKHPERAHRGFFPPPTFKTTPAPPPVPAAEGDGGNQVDERVQLIVRGLVVDLNRSIGAQEGSSAARGRVGTSRSQPAPGLSAASASGGSRRNRPPAAAAGNDENGEGRDKGFDLNRVPSPDDDEESGEE